MSRNGVTPPVIGVDDDPKPGPKNFATVPVLVFKTKRFFDASKIISMGPAFRAPVVSVATGVELDVNGAKNSATVLLPFETKTRGVVSMAAVALQTAPDCEHAGDVAVNASVVPVLLTAGGVIVNVPGVAVGVIVQPVPTVAETVGTPLPTIVFPSGSRAVIVAVVALVVDKMKPLDMDPLIPAPATVNPDGMPFNTKLNEFAVP